MNLAHFAIQYSHTESRTTGKSQKSLNININNHIHVSYHTREMEHDLSNENLSSGRENFIEINENIKSVFRVFRDFQNI